MSSLFSPDIPEVEETDPIPDVDDESVARARSREVASQRARGGTRSTLLSQGSGPSGNEFSRSLLG